jgi:hypothetical protein
MKSRLMTVNVAWFALAAGYAQAASVEVRGRWERAGAGYACTHVSRPPTVADCYYMGPVFIGLDSAELDALLGAPNQTHAQPSGETHRVYFLEDDADAPYLVATVLQGRAVAIQLTGKAAYHRLNFNGIALGTAAEKVLAMFGEPKATQPARHPGTEFWSYAPWTFSFEITDGRVTSIRVADPDHR